MEKSSYYAFGKKGTAVSFASFLSRPMLMKETKSDGHENPSDLLS